MTEPASTSPELEWIQMRKDFDKDQIETGKEKFIRKFKQNPLIPIGEFNVINILLRKSFFN